MEQRRNEYDKEKTSEGERHLENGETPGRGRTHYRRGLSEACTGKAKAEAPRRTHNLKAIAESR